VAVKQQIIIYVKTLCKGDTVVRDVVVLHVQNVVYVQGKIRKVEVEPCLFL